MRFSRETPAGLRRAWQEPLPGAGPHAPRTFFVDFDAQAFDPNAYLVAGIACPPDVARSVPKRKAEFFFGRLAARCAMDALGEPRSEVGIGARREPVWPRGLVGSITHSVGRAAAVVLPAASFASVGIDIECVAEASRGDTLRAQVVDTAEYRCIEACASSTAQLDELLTVAFSAKESLFKAASPAVGRYFGFDAVRLVALDPQCLQVVLELRAHLCDAWPAGSRFEVAYARPDGRMVFTCCLQAQPQGRS